MKIKWATLILCIATPLIVGGVAGRISGDSMGAFQMLNQPPLSPPGWLFGIVWSLLYILMGIASYLVITSSAPKEMKNKAIRLYALQLLFNFAWSIWFFNFALYYFAFAWLLVLLFLIVKTFFAFKGISKASAYLLIPYILWVTFAGYLNLGIALLN